MKHIKSYQVFEEDYYLNGRRIALALADKLRLADNPNTQPEYLALLKNDKSSYIRELIARNPKTPIEILIEMSGDNYSAVRRSVANNPNTPIEILLKLSQDRDSEVRRIALANPSLPEDLTDWAVGLEDSWL